MKKVLLFVLFCGVLIVGCQKIEEQNSSDEVVSGEVVSEEVSNNGNVSNMPETSINEEETSKEEIVEADNLEDLAAKQFENGDFDAAVATYTKIIEQDSNNMGLYIDRGRAKRNAGDLEGALEDINKALESRQEGWIYAERANVYAAKEEKELALQDFKKALYIDPSLDWVADTIKELENN